MKNLKMLKDLGYELNILQSIRFNTKIQFDLESLDKFVNEVLEYTPTEEVEATEETPIKLLDLVDFYGLKGRSRKQMLVYNRMLLSSYLKKNTTMTLKFIGSLFDLEHDTIIYYLGQYQKLKTDKYFRECTSNLKNDLKRLAL
jgi:chromosomal replication initiation ATPase DnaA